MNKQMAAEEGSDTVASVLDRFSEKDEVLSLIAALPTIFHDFRLVEAGLERWTVIMDKYQEQPHLIDPFISEFVDALFLHVRDPETTPPVFHQTFKYLYLLSKVRGPKVIVRWFSHDVADLEFVLTLIEAQDMNDHDTWETRYILLLWLSIVVMIPFELSRFDGGLPGAGGGAPQRRVADRIMEVAKKYLHVTDKSQDAAAMLLAKFITRPDQITQKLPEFVDWCLVILNSADNTSMQGMIILLAVLNALSSLFKGGKREDLLPFSGVTLKHLLHVGLTAHHNTKLRKLNMKLAQRLGMVFLKPKVATWRYQRGNRSLLMNLDPKVFSTTPAAQLGGGAELGGANDEDEGYDIPEETEQVMGLLLEGLKDKDTVVRWSAAKGVGRVTGRLPKELADEVVGSVLELCRPMESDGAWHGACLALAELSRRGLLLPHRLDQVVPVILQALIFDEKRGTYSVGSHVRDAACYVCWAFARAYEPEVLKPYVKDIACQLLIATVFDREVNCRKAASAAFQENVGRQGTFPHGIDILTTADYFTVGNRNTTFLEISVYIAQFEEYTRPMITHLLLHKVNHWDSVVRELSSQALHNLTERDPEYMKGEVLPKLLPQAMSADLYTRHGAVLAVAELSHALHKQSAQNGSCVSDYIGTDVVNVLKALPGRLKAAHHIKGLGGEVMRPAVLHYIHKLCLCHVRLLEKEEDSAVLDTWQLIVEDNFSHAEETVRGPAVEAFEALCKEYYAATPAMVQKTQDTIIRKCLHELMSPNHFTRMGFSLALGALPKELLCDVLKPVLSHLAQLVSAVQETESKYVEARRDAVRAITRICVTVDILPLGSDGFSLSEETLTVAYEALLTAMTDYTTDSRGDVGALVREAGMSGLEELTKLVAAKEPALLTPELVTHVMQNLVQQASEKIDRTRALACETLVHLVHHSKPPIPHIPHHHELAVLFAPDMIQGLDWKVAQYTFPLTVPLVSMETYAYHTLLGLSVSVGGLTESTVRQSSFSLLAHLKEVSKVEGEVDRFGETVLEVFRRNPKDARVVVPLFKTVDLMLSNGAFDVWREDSVYPEKLLALCKEEIAKSKDVKKLLASVNVFCSLLQYPGTTRTKVLSQLMVLLCHSYPRVRRATADQLYVTLLTFDDIFQDESISEHVAAILSETVWEDPLETVRPERNRICGLIGVPQPVLKSKGGGKKKMQTAAKDDMESYRDLVDRAGY